MCFILRHIVINFLFCYKLEDAVFIGMSCKGSI